MTEYRQEEARRGRNEQELAAVKRELENSHAEWAGKVEAEKIRASRYERESAEADSGRSRRVRRRGRSRGFRRSWWSILPFHVCSIVFHFRTHNYFFDYYLTDGGTTTGVTLLHPHAHRLRVSHTAHSPVFAQHDDHICLNPS